MHRVAVVGCGGVSGMHLRGYGERPDRAQVVAVVDPDAGRRRQAQEAFGVASGYPSVADLLQAEDVDVVTVCTPTDVRLPVVRELVGAGKHLLVEKPMADGLRDATEMVRLAASAQVLLGVNQNFRDHYAFGLAAEVIRSGRVGRVTAVDHKDLTFREVSGWRATSARHVLSVMGVHWFDGIRQLLDDDVDQVLATTSRSPVLTAAGETDATVQMRCGGVPVSYLQSFSSRVERTETIVICETAALVLGYASLEIHGADGVEVLSNPYATAKHASAYRSLERLLDGMDDGTEPANSGADNLKTLSLLEAAYRSAENGEVVRLVDGLLT